MSSKLEGKWSYSVTVGIKLEAQGMVRISVVSQTKDTVKICLGSSLCSATDSL